MRLRPQFIGHKKHDSEPNKTGISRTIFIKLLKDCTDQVKSVTLLPTNSINPENNALKDKSQCII